MKHHSVMRAWGLVAGALFALLVAGGPAWAGQDSPSFAITVGPNHFGFYVEDGHSYGHRRPHGHAYGQRHFYPPGYGYGHGGHKKKYKHHRGGHHRHGQGYYGGQPGYYGGYGYPHYGPGPYGGPRGGHGYGGVIIERDHGRHDRGRGDHRRH